LKTAFKTSFVRDLKALRSKRISAAVEQLIEAVEEADSLKFLPNVKKLQGEGNFYRVRVENVNGERGPQS
jgi:mRNA-degrading endonuclease RelE of RelBE toxin-antitoxin system